MFSKSIFSTKFLKRCKLWKSPQEEMCVLLAQSYPTLCDPMDCSPPGSSVHGILQARLLEWVAMPSSRGPFQPRDRTHVSLALQADSLPLSHWGSPQDETDNLNSPISIYEKSPISYMKESAC